MDQNYVCCFREWQQEWRNSEDIELTMFNLTSKQITRSGNLTPSWH